ncbi:MAG TPA: hypothetical protein VGO18_33815 [Steroidobacteraceae bacterium]|nr:hypothetical protein [Steroidobacteraceae bacterium]
MSLCFCVAPVAATSQQTTLHDQRSYLELGAQTIGVATHETPAVQGRSLTEGYLTQPAIMVHAGVLNGHLVLAGTVNLEGATLKRGELTPGIYGEGYIDRRHPHTYLHELVIAAKQDLAGASVSLSGGKGFAPFGTDDPMARPFEKYPVNHHLAQVLERAVAIAAVRAGQVILELGTFNGDEPVSPGDVPNRNRYWDSWSGRLTLVPFEQIELQSSYARVKSPENATGGGSDQRKKSASVRLEDAQHSGYALAEWARTGDFVGNTRSFEFTSWLLESEARIGFVRAGVRLERTERPDEERLQNPFRAQVPGTDLSILGRSRWTTLTGRVAVPIWIAQPVALEPFIEVARARVSPTFRPAGFDPRQFYGSSRIWSISAGAKLSFGMQHMRMGRYGAAITEPRGMMMEAGGMNMSHSH